jgi:outer membrane protein TolC
MSDRIQPKVALALGAVLLVLTGGCSPAHYRKSADQEAYRLVAEKTWQVPNMDPGFTIEQTNEVNLEGLPRVEHQEEFLGTAEESEEGAPIVSLDQALGLGVEHSRLYQNTKEQLYISALGLSLARHAFTPLFSAPSSVDYNANLPLVREIVGYEPDPGNPGANRPVYRDTVLDHNVRAEAGLKVDWLIRDLGRISAAFTLDFTRFVSGDPRWVASSELAATLTRPLLRNAGYKRELEVLTQSERDFLYAVRDFTRFRKTFSVDVASAYYGVLGNRDRARNAYVKLLSGRKTAERTRALAKEGRTPQSDLGRVEQQELSAELSWISAVRLYKRSLDDFKIQLGLPVEMKLVLDERELAELKIRHPQISVEDAVRVAFEARLDYQNDRDKFDDATRKVALAADGLKMQVDVTAKGGITSNPTTNGFPSLSSGNAWWGVGIAIDPALDRKLERNVYRSALISQAQAARTFSQSRDQIELQVRESWRTLEQAKRSYEISELGVKMNERRVEEQDLLAELGRAKAQDQVDAQNDLTSSKNDLTLALVAHTIARLQFWNNMGILYIKDAGQWEEVNDGSTQ